MTPPLVVTPAAELIGYTSIDPVAMKRALRQMGVETWQPNDSVSEGEALVEFYGRLCYKSFEIGLNPNITRIRENTGEYIKNIAAQKHGSVMEHVMVNFAFTNVSRVFTHELVRHRQGVAISQESMRYVRMTEGISMSIPSVIEKNPKAKAWAIEKISVFGEWQRELSALLGVEEMTDFNEKKVATSAMRRFVGDGVATHIGWSANIRALRHVISERTSPHAEEEIRVVFDTVAQKCREKYPFFFADFTRQEDGAWVPKYAKI